MTAGLLEPVTSAIGDELTDLAGLRSTRLTALFDVGDTTANVESTLGWDDAGTVFIEGVQYRYTSKTLSTLDGLDHFDDVDFVPGAKQRHQPLAEVVDFTRNFSVLDKLRRSLLVAFADGEDLTVVGSKVAVDRPPALVDDEVFRAVIQAIAYTAAGTLRAMAPKAKRTWPCVVICTTGPVEISSAWTPN